MLNELKKSINRLETWERLADQAQEAWEAAADRFYELQWNEWLHAVNILATFIGIEEKTAREMLNRGNRKKLMNILKTA